MIEHVKKLTEEARKLSPKERMEFLRALSAMVEEDGYDSDAAAVAECQHPQDDRRRKPGVPGWEVTASYTVSA